MKLGPERAWALKEAGRYWPRGGDAIAALPVPRVEPPAAETLPPLLTTIQLPEWACDLGVAGALVVPAHSAPPSSLAAWHDVDWFLATFWFLSGAAERAHEAARGPIHSYRWRLKRWPDAMWDHAWVNRIALFLRRWCARRLERAEDELFGRLPDPEIVVTHDIDAIRKTTSIRLKQSGFHAFNALRGVLQGDARRGLEKLRRALRFLFSTGDYWGLDAVQRLEETYRLRSHLNVYAGCRRSRGWRSRLVDPSYSVAESPLAERLRDLRSRGWTVGLHQSSEAWEAADPMREERQSLERTLGTPVTSCRQHWLRFSWLRTWAAQEESGFRLDMTLGFNDRPGFRNGAALRFRPWALGGPLSLEALPLVLMDSHLYDYLDLPDSAVAPAMSSWIGEIVAVRGTASVLWHPHTLSEDYGWAAGFRALLALCGANADGKQPPGR